MQKFIEQFFNKIREQALKRLSTQYIGFYIKKPENDWKMHSIDLLIFTALFLLLKAAIDGVDKKHTPPT